MTTFSSPVTLDLMLADAIDACFDVLHATPARRRACGFGPSTSAAPGFARYALPYCVERIDDARGIVLNRIYKPLGLVTGYHVDYLAFPAWHVPTAVLERGAAGGCWQPRATPGYLYHDGCTPWSGRRALGAYVERLCRFRWLCRSRPGERLKVLRQCFI